MLNKAALFRHRWAKGHQSYIQRGQKDNEVLEIELVALPIVKHMLLTPSYFPGPNQEFSGTKETPSSKYTFLVHLEWLQENMEVRYGE